MGNAPNDWLALKQQGNEHFKGNAIKEAVESYSEGLRLCENEDDKMIFYRNRAACYLKLEKYEETIKDADAVLSVHVNDVKALFRRCQANDALGNIEAAYKDIKQLIKIEPKNKAIQDEYRKLTIVAQEKVSKRNSTSAMITEMVDTISDANQPVERVNQALTNLVIYSHQSGGREILLKEGFLSKLVPLLAATPDKCSYLMKICHGFCENNYNQSLLILSILSVEKVSELIFKFSTDIEFMKCALSFITECLKVITDHSKAMHKLAPEHEKNNFYIRESNQNVKESLERLPQYKYLLNIFVKLLSEKMVPANSRDVVIDAYIKALTFHKAVADFIIENRGITKMLELASMSLYPMMKSEGPLPMNIDSYFHISAALSTIYDHLDYDEKKRKKFSDQAESIIKILLDSQTHNSNLQGLIALSTILIANRDVGNVIAGKDNTVSKVIKITSCGEEIAQLTGGEAIALAATDKNICSLLASSGLEIIQTLYLSTNNEIRVKGLVALCKVCMKGSGDVKDKILEEGGALKLYTSCRKFLLSDKKIVLKKWAAEGLGYLTLDADVKEYLANDLEALNGLIDLAKANEPLVTLSVCNAFVNLTNSYDKREKNPELEKIAEFAKQPLPQEHEKDGEEYVQKRVKILVDNGLVTALVNFGDVKSKYSKEMMARVLSAVVEDVSYRGTVVAQGGVKVLLLLALDGTTKGVDLASQALARIGITSDPRLAFSGQRCMEVVRPLVKLLHFEKEPLYRFEALMALTNLSSMNDDVRRRIMKEKGFIEIESLMFEEDDDYRRAATECMCNLVNNEEAHKMFKQNTVTERLKLVTMYCGEEPLELARAAAGTLAILTADKEICTQVIEYKSTLEILKYLVSSDNLDVRHRGLFIVANMMESEKFIAEKLINDQMFEVLMALKLTSAGNANIEKELERCILAAKKWELIKENTDK